MVVLLFLNGFLEEIDMAGKKRLNTEAIIGRSSGGAAGAGRVG